MKLIKKLRCWIFRHKSECFYYLATDGLYELRSCYKCGLQDIVNLATYKQQIEYNIYNAFKKDELNEL